MHEREFVTWNRPAELPREIPLIVAVQGFIDAGGVALHTAEAIAETLEAAIVGEFDVDLIIDHRARRPITLFRDSRIANITEHHLTVSLVEDDLGAQFYLFSGLEPDYGWARVTDAIEQFVTDYDIASVTFVHGIPMPVPHTRPVTYSVTGNRDDLIEQFSAWRAETRVPGLLTHFIEARVSEHTPTATFAVHVPHYINGRYLPATLAALDGVTTATGLVFRTEHLREQERQARADIEAELVNEEEVREVVATLERRYDRWVEDNDLRSALTDTDGTIPSGDEIGEELERFLRKEAKRRGDDPDALGPDRFWRD